MAKEVVLVEDDLDLGTVVSGYLRLKGFSVHHCSSAEAALAYFLDHQDKVALLIIDVQLPGMDGFELAKLINKKSNEQLFLFLTARNTKDDRLKGLAIGAIDYITKPFEVDELVLRVRNMLDRISVKDVPLSKRQIGDVIYDPDQLSLLFPDQSELTLTLRESEVLQLLLTKPNQVVPKKELLMQIWHSDDYFNGKSLEVIISRLRRQLKKSQLVSIESRYGLGYLLKVGQQT